MLEISSYHFKTTCNFWTCSFLQSFHLQEKNLNISSLIPCFFDQMDHNIHAGTNAFVIVWQQNYRGDLVEDLILSDLFEFLSAACGFPLPSLTFQNSMFYIFKILSFQEGSRWTLLFLPQLKPWTNIYKFKLHFKKTCLHVQSLI